MTETSTLIFYLFFFGGGENINLFMFCPTNFFWNKFFLRLMSGEICRAESNYVRILIWPPPPIKVRFGHFIFTDLMHLMNSTRLMQLVDNLQQAGKIHNL